MKLLDELTYRLRNLRFNWFRITVIALVLYVIFKRDLAFQFEIQAPNSNGAAPVSAPVVDMEEPATQVDRRSEKLGLLRPADDGARQRPVEGRAPVAEHRQRAYLQRFVEVARVEQEKFGIPASIVLATALNQSLAGTHPAAADGLNNHFGLLCTGQSGHSPVWAGQCRKVGSHSYRSYGTAWESFRDFSHFTSRKFSHLTGENCRVWAAALGQLLYNADPDFAAKLLAVIARYDLEAYDE